MTQVNNYYLVEQIVRRALAIEMLLYEDEGYLKYDRRKNDKLVIDMLVQVLKVIESSENVLMGKLEID